MAAGPAQLQLSQSTSNTMKKLTRFLYENQGTKYSGVLPGHLNRNRIQAALLEQRKGCAKIWSIAHTVERA